MAELTHLGDHCSLEGCNQLDFLPVLCSHCQKIFCKLHFSPMYHACDKFVDVQVKSKDKGNSYSCSLQNCPNKELIPIACKFCLQIFCLKHLFTKDHNCANEPQNIKRAPLSLAEIEELKNICSSKKPVITGTKNKALANKVQLMKLKQSAIGLASIPASERLYFSVFSPNESLHQAVYVSKFWSVGKTVDDISERLKVKNTNNIPTSPQLRLSNVDDEVLEMNATLKDLLESKIFNGDTLKLKYI